MINGSPGDWRFIWHTDEGVMSATTGTLWVFIDEDDSVPRGTTGS